MGRNGGYLPDIADHGGGVRNFGRGGNASMPASRRCSSGRGGAGSLQLGGEALVLVYPPAPEG